MKIIAIFFIFSLVFTGASGCASIKAISHEIDTGIENWQLEREEARQEKQEAKEARRLEKQKARERKLAEKERIRKQKALRRERAKAKYGSEEVELFCKKTLLDYTPGALLSRGLKLNKYKEYYCD